ncbi:MAG: hypothetical protein JEZ09_06490 [Salinivirgaceae bacterium]|nr:hypothetical protein [Salinivirgaceae bacterium]
MNYYIKNILFVSILVLIMVGCQTVGTVSIQVITPAEVNIPGPIKNLLIVNNSIVEPSSPFTLEIQKQLFSLDTLATQYIVNTVGAIIDESPRMESVIVLPDIYYKKPKELLKAIPWNEVQQICEANNTQGLLSLEAFAIDDTLVNYSYYDGYGYTYYKSMVLIVNSLWRIYDPYQKQIIDKKIYRDTIAFENFSSRNAYSDALAKSASRVSIAEQISHDISAAIADRIMPYWVTEKRNFFVSGSQELVQAANFVYKDQWIDAAKIWQKYTEEENSRIAAAACYNMALACEVQGKIDLALIWIEKSIMKYNHYLAIDYKNTLKERARINEKLDKQFGLD